MLFRYGKFTVDNLIHLVLDSTYDLQPTLWYICEFHSWKNSENWPITRLKSPSSFSERDAATAKKDLSLKQDQQLIIQREKDLAQREKTIAQKEKNLAQKETLLQQNLLRAELREREALEFEQEAKIKLEEVDEKEQELEAEKEKLKKNKNKGRFSTSSTPTHHDAENSDDDENPTNENNDDNNQWLLRFSNLQQRLETAYREIEGLRRPVSPAGATKTTTATTTANGDNDNNNNDDSNEDNENENSSSIIPSLQHELKLTKENAQKQKEENLLLRKKMNQSKNFAFSEQNVSSERNLSTLRRRGIRDNLDDDDEASSVGNRWAPLNFRVERMMMRRREERMGMGSATTTGRRGRGRSRRRREGEEEEEGIVGMIEMQKEFRFLGRLR